MPPGQVKHAYVPEILGKEARKRQASKEGKLGVEGMRPEVLRQALRRAGATILDGVSGTAPENGPPLTKADLFALGLSGGEGSAERRRALLQRLELPQHLSSNALLEFLNAVSDATTVEKLLLEIDHK